LLQEEQIAEGCLICTREVLISWCC